jgi:hypothetical protein
LDAGGFVWETILAGGTRWLLVHEFKLPARFTQPSTSVAVAIPSGYATTQLDMAYFYPPVQRTDNKQIPRTEASQQIDGKNWQRWSRHYTPQNPWKAGEYNTVTHLHLIQHWLERAAA